MDDCLDFWHNDANVPFVEMPPVGNGVQQHRHAIGDSLLKINHSRQPLPNAPASGYRHLQRKSITGSLD
ncbi:MAG: hypothetical protein O7C67_03825 [Gammaproteobacteria bacterium]|nr:hypothetical protein [Gammaproteobacteria bacterium]